MPALFRHRLTVSASAIDGQGHVNNLAYLQWMQDAAVAHSAAQGWNTLRYREIGSAWVVRSHWIKYLQPAFEGEKLVVATWVASFGKVRSLRKYRVFRENDRAVLASAETDWAFIGLEHRVPRRIPDVLIASFEVLDDESAIDWEAAPFSN